MNRLFLMLLSAVLIGISSAVAEDVSNAGLVVKDAIEYWRDQSSIAQATMTIHRPDFERVMSLRSWTKGRDQSLILFTGPAKDAGNASLMLSDQMWSYSPKIRRTIKIPPSMVHQSWMGSDFSYNDLSKADDIIDNYTHTVVGHEQDGGQEVLIIDSIPHDDAPVVWGREQLKIRADKIILEHSYFDQSGTLIKRMRATQVVPVGGKLYAKTIRMENLEKTGDWTEVVHDQMQFGPVIPDDFFAVGTLVNPRIAE
jgi:hypothetical protein